MPIDLSIDNRNISRVLTPLCNKVLAIDRFIESNSQLSDDCIVALDRIILSATPIIRALFNLLAYRPSVPIDNIRRIIHEAEEFPDLAELLNILDDLCSENFSSNTTSPNYLGSIPSGSLFYESSE